MYKLTHSHEQSQQKSTTIFFKNTLVARCLRMINRHGKQAEGFFLDFFCPVSWKTTLSLHRCQATFSSCHSNPDPSKTNFPSCCHGSSKYGNGVPLCRGPRLRECTTAWQSVWLCGRIKHGSRSLYSFPKHQRQLCAVADKKEVKLLKNWTSRLGAESAICGVEVKEMPLFSQQHSCGIQVSATANLNVWRFIRLFQNASKSVTARLWLQFVCFTSCWENGKDGRVERSKRCIC